MMLEVHSLCKTFGEETVLHDLSFSAGEGVTCIMAPSGSGKTTLLRLLLGLDTADSGTITTPPNTKWAAVFQEDRLLEQLDAAGNLAFALGKGNWRQRAEEMLDSLGLSYEDPKPVAEYSGGMKRRLALARALLAEADILVLDEPFTGLDENNRLEAAECIRREKGKCILLVTHREEDAADFGATVLRL